MASAPDSRFSVSARASTALRDFLRAESAGAVLLAIGAIAALVWANSPWSSSYDDLWSSRFSASLPGITLDLDARHWVNDGVMTLFFFVVGLEIKRELTIGHLRSRRAAMLPAIAALSGMAVPALIYVAVAGTTEPRGWAIPVATDIALAVGVLSVVGSRAPASLRAFLLALAIVDDIGAIVIIAVVYSSGVAAWWLLGAVVAVPATLALQKTPVRSPLAYVMVGGWMWLALHESGVHPTLAGVAMGLLAPATVYRGVPLIDWLQRALHPLSSFLVVPVFALANIGIDLSLAGMRDAVGSPITWGVGLGLLVGKPLGVVLATRVAVRAGIADEPSGGSLRQLVGTGAAAGIGFTVAMLITELALEDPADQADAKLAILVASVLSAALSLVLLTSRNAKKSASE